MTGRIKSWGCSVGFCVAAMALGGDNVPTTEREPLQCASTRCAHVRHDVTAGRQVVIDPATGRILPHPIGPAVALPPQAQDTVSTSGEGLREVPGKTRGGGMKVDLQGRFQSTVSASIDSTGRLTTRCQTEASNTGTPIR